MKEQFSTLLHDFRAATSASAQIEVIDKIYQQRAHFESMGNVANIRHTINTSDSFFEKEQDYFDNHYPIYLDLVSQFYKELLESTFQKELQEKFGRQLFEIARMTRKTFSPEIIHELQRENELATEYTKLVATAEIEFDGCVLNLAAMVPYKVSANRVIRKSAHEKTDEFFVTQSAEFDRIFNELVKVRHTIAQKLGFENFVSVGYLRMFRTDYDAEMVKEFRKKVEEKIVPLVTQLKSRQCKRLQLETLMYFDEPLDYRTGNAQPKGSPEWIMQNAATMYRELSPETGEFFQFMLDNELMDLVNKPNKASGGYCTFISETLSPFIFSNFNGTSNDIDVLTHEAGHAFQTFCSRHLGLEEYFFPTSEAAEIHSMSMEFLTWPWMNLFFDDQTEKYKFAHLSHSLIFLPYGVAVDEFQHHIYQHPDLTPAERNAFWRTLEKKYLPHRVYENNEYLEQGGYWQRQAHIYKHPFYYIDYTLAQICAFQFWIKSNKNRDEAIRNYIELCCEGGSKSFLELVKIAKLDSPFEDHTFISTVTAINSWLAQTDDNALN
jgi:M3 family oligoendopeptidase